MLRLISRIVAQIFASFAETTKPLCHFEGLMRRTDERYVSSDCELSCRCSANGTTVCEPLQCRRGLLRRGKYNYAKSWNLY